MHRNRFYWRHLVISWANAMTDKRDGFWFSELREEAARAALRKAILLEMNRVRNRRWRQSKAAS